MIEFNLKNIHNLNKNLIKSSNIEPISLSNQSATLYQFFVDDEKEHNVVFFNLNHHFYVSMCKTDGNVSALSHFIELHTQTFEIPSLELPLQIKTSYESTINSEALIFSCFFNHNPLAKIGTVYFSSFDYYFNALLDENEIESSLSTQRIYYEQNLLKKQLHLINKSKLKKI